MKNDFNFFVPFDEEAIEKASKGPIEDRYKNMYLQGMASDDTEDLEGETLEPNGFELEHFLKNGKVNYEHLSKRSPKFWIGEPVSGKIKDNKFFIKAKLWENSPVARDTWDKIIEMRESGTTRKAGWSIEGKSIEKNPNNPKNIKRALITNIAVTFDPINGNSWAEICKGLQKEDYVEPEYGQDTDDKPFVFEFENKGKKFRVGEDYKVYEVIQKAMDIVATKPLVPESLDKKTKNIALSDISKAITNVLKHKRLIEQNPELKIKMKEFLKKSL